MKKLLRVAAFTGGQNVPSARFRIRQYIPALRQHHIDITEYHAGFGSYPPRRKLIRPLWGGLSLLQRLPQVLLSHSCNITLLQREMISTLTTIEGLTKRPRILDVDDAIWLNRPGFSERLAQQCDAVICGNEFLAEFYAKYNKSVHIVPTAVDCERFRPAPKKNQNVPLTLVWSGTSSGHTYLFDIEPALSHVLENFGHIRLRIISDHKPELRSLPEEKVDFVLWSALNEVTALQSAHIGLMPLKNSQWEMGKCSFKMLTYMACGLPVVVSPVGMNADILCREEIGFGAETLVQWQDAISFLIRNSAEAIRMGRTGRQMVKDHFGIEKNAALLARIFHSYV